MSNPWAKFFWQDWETDPALRLCSLAAQGLWMRMLCIASAHEPIGYVAVAGKPLNETSLARLTGAQESEIASLLGELGDAGVYSRDAKGRIYSRRMIRDARKSAEAKKNGKLGGNPNLSKQTRISGEVKGQDNSEDKPQKPEARGSVDKSTGGEPPADPVKEMFDLGVALLTSTGCTEKEARSLIGKWRKTKLVGEVLTGLVECRARAISSPVEWLEKRFNGAKYVSANGYEYRGSLEEVLRQAEKRNDMGTYWKVKAELKAAA